MCRAETASNVRSCAEGVSPPGGSVRMYRASSSRGMHPAPPSPGVVQLDFPAVVAQRKAVAAYGRHDAERIEVCQRGAFRGDRDAARGVFDDDRPVKFAVEVIGRDESADGDVLRYRDAALPVAERFEVGDRILRLRRTDREFGLRGPVASGRQRQQDRQRQQANACSRSHRAV